MTPCAHLNFCPVIGISDSWYQNYEECISIPEATKCVVACCNMHENLSTAVLSPAFYSLRPDWPINPEMSCWGQGNSNFTWKACRPRRWWTNAPNNHLTWVQSSGFLYATKEKGMASCCGLLDARILCKLCLDLVTNVPIKLQQDKCDSLCNISLINEWKSVITLKVRALRMGSIYFRLLDSIPLQNQCD